MDGSDPAQDVHAIVRELQKFSVELGDRERWLVLNKSDLLPEHERQPHCRGIVQRLDWEGPVFEISALSKQGTRPLLWAIMEYIEKQRQGAAEEA
jgi:GTP-binding protein